MSRPGLPAVALPSLPAGSSWRLARRCGSDCSGDSPPGRAGALSRWAHCSPARPPVRWSTAGKHAASAKKSTPICGGAWRLFPAGIQVTNTGEVKPGRGEMKLFRRPCPRLAWAVAMALVVAVLAAACTSAPAAPAHQAGAPQDRRIVSLDNISTLRSLFNRDDGRARLVLILSPT